LWAGIQKFIFAIEVQVHENLINHILTAVTDTVANLGNWFILETQFDVTVSMHTSGGRNLLAEKIF
jgi:hypothetical protein